MVHFGVRKPFVHFGVGGKNYVCSTFFTRSMQLSNRIKTDSGGYVEYTKAFEISLLKELGKLTL